MSDYEPVFFPCEAEGCSGEIGVYDEAKLRWYYRHGNGEKPGGVGRLCDDCEAAVEDVTVPCLNHPEPGVEGDRGCIGDGLVHIAELNSKAAFYYVLNGQRERPSGVEFCKACLEGTVYSAECRCKGCVGVGRLFVNGSEKLSYRKAQRRGEDRTWPPRKCHDCREYIKSRVDVTLQCSACLGMFIFTAHDQAAMVIFVKREDHRIPERCDRCASVDPSELRRIKRSAHSARRAWERRWAYYRLAQSQKGRDALAGASVEALERVIATQRFVDPDEGAIRAKEREIALVRAAAGGDATAHALADALSARDSDPAGIQRALANPAIGDGQATSLARALGVLAAGGKMPTRLLQHYASRYDLPVTTAFAGIHSDSKKHAQAAAYEIVATAAILQNPTFPVYFDKSQIEYFHERMNTDPDFTACRSFESDILVGTKSDGNVLIDFKHSLTGQPNISAENIEKVLHGLTHGQIDQAIFVVSAPLPTASAVRLIEANNRLEAYARETGDTFPPIKCFVQPWP